MAKIAPYACMKESIIEKHDHAIFGNGKPGLEINMALANEKLTAILKRQNNTAGWVKALLTFACGLLITAATLNIKDHYRVNQIESNYVTEKYLLQVLNAQEDVIEIRTFLNENMQFHKDMNATRGVKADDVIKK